MCGLAGTFAYDERAAPVDEAELLRVRDHMKARGPDGAGLWLSEDQRVGLAHRRLAIIDLSEGGAQPMRDPQTQNWIVFNGEIYNHAALRARLHRVGVTTCSLSDTATTIVWRSSWYCFLCSPRSS